MTLLLGDDFGSSPVCGQLSVVEEDSIETTRTFRSDLCSGCGWDSNSLSTVYCSGKPILAMATAMAVSADKLQFNTRCGELVELLPEPFCYLTIADLLGHRAGLEWPPAAAFFGVKQEVDLLTELRPSDTLGSSSYSEFAGWQLLARCLDSVPPYGWRNHVEALLRRWNLADDVFFDQVPLDRFRCHSMRWGDFDTTVTIEMANASIARDAAIGCVASASGLARAYSQFARCVGGESDVVSVDASHFLLGAADGPRNHSTLGRICRLGHGFFLDVSSHGFATRATALSYGHSGADGSSAGFFDPQRRAAVAVCLSRMDRDEGSVRARTEVMRFRNRVCNAALLALDGPS